MRDTISATIVSQAGIILSTVFRTSCRAKAFLEFLNQQCVTIQRGLFLSECVYEVSSSRKASLQQAEAAGAESCADSFGALNTSIGAVSARTLSTQDLTFDIAWQVLWHYEQTAKEQK